MITLNPLVVSHHLLDPHIPSNSGPTIYSITDKIEIPLWPTTVTYTASFENTEIGVRSHVRAPMGVVTDGECEVITENSTEHGDGMQVQPRLVLRETTTVQCNVLLMPYVRATMRKSHEKLHARFVEGLLRGQDARGGSKDGGAGTMVQA